MADLFVSYQIKSADGGMGFGSITIGGRREPRTSEAVEALRKFIRDDCAKCGQPNASIVILWWKELGHA